MLPCWKKRSPVWGWINCISISPMLSASIYNLAMRNSAISLLLASSCLIACNKSTAPAPAATASSTAAPTQKSDAVEQKLAEYSGTGASDCGRFNLAAPQTQLKAASDCAMQANQSKRPFHVAYDMPGMSVGVAGNSEGKLFSVQTQGSALSSGACPSALRIAASGRVTFFSPGDMSSMGTGHMSGSMPSGTPNPHTKGNTNPHGANPPQ